MNRYWDILAYNDEHKSAITSKWMLQLLGMSQTKKTEVTVSNN